MQPRMLSKTPALFLLLFGCNEGQLLELDDARQDPPIPTGSPILHLEKGIYRSDTHAKLIVAGPADSGTLECAQEPSLKPPSSQTPSTLRFENSTDSLRKLCWIDPNGNRAARGVLAPGGVLQVPTSVGHIWLYADETERCIGLFAPPTAKENLINNK